VPTGSIINVHIQLFRYESLHFGPFALDIKGGEYLGPPFSLDVKGGGYFGMDCYWCFLLSLIVPTACINQQQHGFHQVQRGKLLAL